jgi:hypothetical protein
MSDNNFKNDRLENIAYLCILAVFLSFFVIFISFSYT